MIQRVLDDGWIRLRRGTIRRSSARARMSCVGSGLLMIGTMVVIVWLRLPAIFGFFAMSAGLVFFQLIVGPLWDLLWGASVVVFVSRSPTRAGQSFRARWTIGHPQRVADVRVSWRGREESILRGYDSTTFSEVFVARRLDPDGGPTSIDLAPDAMPSFAGKHCRIVWSILVETRQDDGWTAEDFPVTVAPWAGGNTGPWMVGR